MAWTLLTSGSAILAGGANANSTIIANATALLGWANEAEAEACSLARSDVVTNYASLTANGKAIFSQFCSAKVGQRIVAYDMSAYSSRVESTQILNVLENDKNEAKKIITDDRNKTYLGVT